MIHRFLKRLSRYFDRVAAPPKHQLVTNLVMRVASLALMKTEVRTLASLSGVYGPFQISGNSLPVFEYVVFDKKLMEFVKVRVELSLPDRIQFIIETKPATSFEKPKPLPLEAAYADPFWILAEHLYRYFPLERTPHGPLEQPPPSFQGEAS